MIYIALGNSVIVKDYKFRKKSLMVLGFSEYSVFFSLTVHMCDFSIF